MSEVLTLDVVDPDAAILEALDEAKTASRAAFLKRAVVGGGTLITSGVMIAGLPELAFAAGGKSAKRDVAILNFALLLEYLEAAFYTEAENRGNFSGATGRFAKVVGAHERAHVSFLKGALGSKARKKPTFDFRNTTTNKAKFQATAIALEETGVGAYSGQAANLRRQTLPAAASIVAVEARHASWIRDIVRMNPAPRKFDRPFTKAQATARVNATGFIQ